MPQPLKRPQKPLQSTLLKWLAQLSQDETGISPLCLSQQALVQVKERAPRLRCGSVLSSFACVTAHGDVVVVVHVVVDIVVVVDVVVDVVIDAVV